MVVSIEVLWFTLDLLTEMLSAITARDCHSTNPIGVLTLHENHHVRNSLVSKQRVCVLETDNYVVLASCLVLLLYGDQVIIRLL